MSREHGRHCSTCGGEASLFFRTKDFNRRFSEDSFSYFRCSSCGIVFLDPVPEELNDYYPPGYYSLPPSTAELAAASAGERYKIEIVRRFVTGGRLLEIGPGAGGFAYLAKQAGFEVETIEMDERCCRFLTDVVGVRATRSDDASSVLRRAGSYDVIALWHVFEHLHEPWRTLEAAASRLLPGGIIVIAAPNPGALQFRVLRGRWTHMDAPRHLQLVPVQALTNAAHRLELMPALVTTTDEGTLGWNVFGWVESLGNLSTRRSLSALLRKSGRLLARGLGRVERSDLRGSTYTLVFRREEAA